MSQSPTALIALQDRLRPAFRYRWPAVPILLATLAVAIAGLAIPVGPSAGTSDRAGRSTLPGQTLGSAPAEDLTGFLAIDRWGAPATQEEAEPVEEPVEPVGLNPALQGIGFIGVTFMEDEYAVLLNLSAVTREGPQGTQQELEAGLVRLRAGDALPDGRRLVAISADSLTLANLDGDQEEHQLFGDWDESLD
ncbi:MAG: hypothetical protein OXG82_22750 [Gammaproteobacteria bacterium]|nr:hypothetical protein [Gammaproteobacteria bacterium]